MRRLYFEYDNFTKHFDCNCAIFIVIIYYLFKCSNTFVNEWFKPNLNNTTICQLRPI